MYVNRNQIFFIDRYGAIVTERSATIHYYCRMPVYAQLGLTVTDPKSPPFGTYARRAHQDPPPNAEFGGGKYLLSHA